MKTKSTPSQSNSKLQVREESDKMFVLDTIYVWFRRFVFVLSVSFDRTVWWIIFISVQFLVPKMSKKVSDYYGDKRN